MKMTKHNMAKGFTLVELLVVIAIIAALAALSTPVVLKQQKKASLAQAVNNAKQIGYLFKDYDDTYGAYPSTLVEHGFAAAASSNEIFERFYDAGFYDGDEEIFYAKTVFSRKPDGDEVGAARIAAKECGFGYMSGAAGAALSSSNNSSLPLIVTPQTAVNTSVFDGNAFGGSMVYLEIGGAVKTLPISGVAATLGQALVTRGGASVDLMAAANTDWGAVVPTVVPALP